MQPQIITALDVNNSKDALKLVRQLKDLSPYFKVGMELFYSQGRKILDAIGKAGGRVFLDLKFHDIPNTVAAAAASCVHPAVFMINMHTLAGAACMKAFKKSALFATKKLKIAPPKLIGVTVLTSLNEKQIKTELNVKLSLQNHVKRLALLAKHAGLDGVVCSPWEIELIKNTCGKNFLTIVPGIRPLGSDKKDQARVMTPADAAKAGADYLVIGRPITRAKSPRKFLGQTLKDMKDTSFISFRV